MKPELNLSPLIGLIMTVAFCSAGVALAATDEIEVGVTAISVTNAVGTPPISPARDLETGLEVFFNEKIETNPSGRAQLLFRDGTSLTVGSSSEMTIDEYVFDPDTGTGELVINVSKGIFRLVGGKISKNTPVIFNSPSATVAVRGGIAYVKETTGGLEAGLLYGTQLSVTSAAGVTSSTSQAGRAFNVKSGQTTAPKAQKINPETLAQDLAALEKPVDKAPTPADEPQDAGNTAPDTAQSQESAPETESSGTTEGEPATQPQGDPDSPSDEPAQEQGLAQPEPGVQGEFSQEDQPAVETELARVEPGSERVLPETGEPLSQTVSENPEPLAPLSSAEPSKTQAMTDPAGPFMPNDSGQGSDNLPFKSETPVTGNMNPENLPTAGINTTGQVPNLANQVTDMAKSPAAAMPPSFNMPNDSGQGSDNLPLGINTTGQFPNLANQVTDMARPLAAAMPPSFNMKLEISSLAVDLRKNVSAFAHSPVLPMGGSPTNASPPTDAVHDMVTAAEGAAKGTGVKTDEGKSVTSPTGGWEASEAYTFSGNSPAETPTFFDAASQDGTSESALSACPGTGCPCDPAKHGWCPDATPSGADPDKKVVEAGGTNVKNVKHVTKLASKVDSVTIKCDGTSGCKKATPGAGSITSSSSAEDPEPTSTDEATSATEPPDDRTAMPDSAPITPGSNYTISAYDPSNYDDTEPFYDPYLEDSSPTGCPPYSVSCTERIESDKPTIAIGVFATAEYYSLYATVAQGNSTSDLVGDQIKLCEECRFLNWYRNITSVTSATKSAVRIQHWISGAVATAAELSAAVGKTASYSGGLVGSVALPGQITEKLGSFDAQVRFGVSHYQVQNFNAAFDGRSYLGSSASTRNDALFNAVATSGGRVMNAQGYFFGNPAPGTPPPEIGGHFQVTGGGYDAAGVFAGARH